MTGDWLNRNIADDVNPGDIPYRTTDPIPDGDNDDTTRLVEDYYGIWHSDPPDKPLPLRVKILAWVFIVGVPLLMLYGCLRG